MRTSGIGGQAVMEGVMMKNKDHYAVTVRKEDKNMVVNVLEWKSIGDKHKFLALPFIRGSVNLIESMVVGMKTLTYSANFFDEEADTKKEEAKKEKAEKVDAKKADTKKTGEEEKKEKEGLSPLAVALTLLLSLALSIGLFVFLPLLISEAILGFAGLKDSAFLNSLIEGCVRILIFVLYVVLIGLMPDIKRVFRYHGAEHKCINCIEHGYPLTVDNAREASKEHKRCGTSFMIIVMVISILVLSIVNIFPLYTGSNAIIRILVRFGVRILFLPIVAGISYEFLKFAGRSDNKLVNIISRPGMWMQALTTKEPDDSMLEVAINSVEAVFDWQDFLEGGTGVKECVLGEHDIIVESESQSVSDSESDAESEAEVEAVADATKVAENEAV